MAEFFELSLIYKTKPDLRLWNQKLSLEVGSNIYSGRLSFFNDKKLILNDYSSNDYNEFEFSLGSKDLFVRDSVIDMIKKLLATVSEIYSCSKFEYAIGNIETNSSFISSNNGIYNPSKEMMLKSVLLFLPEDKLLNMEINLHHIVFKSNSVACLFNPKAGILYSSQSENYKILKESITQRT